MIDFVKRYYWGLNLIVIGVAAFYAARASLHLLEASYLVDDAATAAPAPRRGPPLNLARKQRSKDPTPILEQNIFCSDCPPILRKQAEPDQSDNQAGQEIKSNLPLALVATLVSNDPDWSFAVIRDTNGRESTNAQGEKVQVFPYAMYRRGVKLPAHEAVVDRVEERRVYLKVSDHLEYLELIADSGSAPKPTGQQPAERPKRGSFRGGPSPNDLKKGVRKVSDTKYEIDRKLLDKILSNTNAIARSARIVPSVSPKDGKPNGFKLYAIRPNSLYSTIGMRNGDTLTAINGQEINSPEKAFELYSKLRTASHVQISVLRRGKPQTFDYSIR